MKPGKVSPDLQIFFYLAPPYWETEGYGVDFGFDQYEQMAEVMRSCKGKVMLSINDHPDIRSVLMVAFDLLAASIVCLIKVL